MILFLLAVALQPTPPPAVATPGTPENIAAETAICRSLDDARIGNDPALRHSLASCYYHGRGRERDLVRARALYVRAAEAGLPQAMCGLGNMMIQGEGGPRDAPGGLALCRRAAESGDAHAQTDLGGRLLRGEVVARDPVEARRWLTQAAERGHANAAFLLGQIFWNGDGVAKDNAQAARWWRVAVQGGRRDAAFLLGNEAFVRLARGPSRPEAVDRSALEEALRWYRNAVESDSAEAVRQEARSRITLLESLRAALPPARR